MPAVLSVVRVVFPLGCVFLAFLCDMTPFNPHPVWDMIDEFFYFHLPFNSIASLRLTAMNVGAAFGQAQWFFESLGQHMAMVFMLLVQMLVEMRIILEDEDALGQPLANIVVSSIVLMIIIIIWKHFAAYFRAILCLF
ncbi:hypothetical protein KCV07_g864, partial [Aureobasidium melanogenum]